MAQRGQMPVEQAAALLMEYAMPAGREDLCLPEAVGRVCAGDLKARIAQPPFDRAALDGYAVRGADLLDASKQTPVLLPVSMRLFAGGVPGAALAPGHAARIMTGAPVPNGADCVIPQEAAGCSENSAAFYEPQTGKTNICLQGEDMAEGTILVRRGTRLQAVHAGLLAGQGICRVPVFRRPSVAVISTGDEIIPMGDPLPPGKIYDSNQPMLCARLWELGARPIPMSPVADRPALLCARISQAMSGCDMLITTGGVSVGEKDYLPEAIGRLGGRLLFHGIAAKPGTPALAAIVDEKLILCLSGNPFAAAITFELLGRPVVEMMGGLLSAGSVRRSAVLGAGFSRDSRQRRFVQARLAGGVVDIADTCHGSGSLSAWADCNCLVDIPAGSPPLCPGQTVAVILLQGAVPWGICQPL